MPACVTVTVLLPMVNVPTREDDDGLDAAVKFTTCEPVPAVLPRVNQEVGVLADQGQPEPVTMLTLLAPPA